MRCIIPSLHPTPRLLSRLLLTTIFTKQFRRIVMIFHRDGSRLGGLSQIPFTTALFSPKAAGKQAGKRGFGVQTCSPHPAPATFDNDSNNGSRMEVAYVSTYAGGEKRLWCINPDFFTPPIDNDNHQAVLKSGGHDGPRLGSHITKICG